MLAAFRFPAVLVLLLAGCGRDVSTTELRLQARSENGREWVEIVAPTRVLKINDWVRGCTGNTEVLYQSPRVLSLACREAAPRYASFRLVNGERLGLARVLQAGTEGPLQEAIDRYLRKKHLGAFRPGDNFALTAQGLMFPTPEGDVIVSSIELRPLLHPEAALLVGR